MLKDWGSAQTSIRLVLLFLSKDQQMFQVSDQRVNILGFVVASVVATQLCYYSTKQPWA
jgi:hypothetical protein